MVGLDMVFKGLGGFGGGGKLAYRYTYIHLKVQDG